MSTRFVVVAVMLAVVVGGLWPAPAGGQPSPTTVPPPPPAGIEVGPELPGETPRAGRIESDRAPDADERPGFFDIGGRVRAAINDWFRDLVTSALEPVLELLGQTVLASPHVAGPGRVRDLWGVAAGIANALFVLIALAGGVVVMSHETLQTRWSAKEIAPRLVVAAIAANASLGVVGLATTVANALSQAFLGQGVTPADATGSMATLVLSPLEGGGIFFVLVAGVAAVLAVLLLAVYVLRVALLVLLTAAAPLALATHGLPQTEGLARLWWRALAAVLAVQVAQSLVLITALRVFFATDARAAVGLPSSGGFVDLLVATTLLWVLVKIPVWAARVVFGGRAGSVTRLTREVVIHRAARAMVA